MNTLPTVEEFLSDEIDRTAFPLIDNWLEDNNQESQTLKDVLIKFAKLHVKAALEAASKIKTYGLLSVPLFNEEQVKLILNVYPENLIK